MFEKIRRKKSTREIKKESSTAKPVHWLVISSYRQALFTQLNASLNDNKYNIRPVKTRETKLTIK
jgi:hypothetical protein